MLTIIGTGHVFNIAEPIMFLIKQIWPQAVLVELDMTRFNAMNGSQPKEGQTAGSEKEEEKKLPWIYRNTAKYQKRMAKGYGSDVGNEMLTAVQTGRLVGAEIGFIDDNAANVMTEIWEEMSFSERARYTCSTLRDRIGGRKEVERVVDNFSENEDKMMEDMRRRYPTLVRKLIDERNEHMANEIRPYLDRYDNVVAVVGDAHVEGISKLLADKEQRKIRLGDILNKDSLDKIRGEVWNRVEE